MYRLFFSGFLAALACSVQAVEPQYLSMHKVSTGSGELSWSSNNPDSIGQAGIDDILDKTGGSKGSSGRRLAFSYMLNYMRGSMLDTTETLERILQLSATNNLAVIIHLDGVNWWNDRPDLWNWWNPAAPGYDPNNVNNVEWFDWGSTHAVKLGWRNWGFQLRVVPQPNLASPGVLNAHKERLDVLLPIIAAWHANLPVDKKHLLGGVVLGGEMSSYVNAYYYANGNSYLDQDPANDPSGNAPASVPLGYAAATTLGIQSSGTISEATQVAIVKYYLEELVATALTQGLPAEKLVTHGFDTSWHSGAGAVVDPVFSNGVVPGWSVYFRSPDTFDPLLDLLGGRIWGAIEFQPWNVTENLLDSYLGYRSCRYVNLVNWETVREDPVGVAAVGSMLSDGRLSGDLLFGELQEGRIASRVLTIQNEGVSPMVVSHVDYPPGFSGSWAGGTIPAGGSQSVAVTFTPQVGQASIGHVTVVSDVLGSPHVRSCSGIAMPALRDLERLVVYDFLPSPSKVDPELVAPGIAATDITEFGDPDGGGSTPDLTNFSGATLNIKRNSMDSNTGNFSDYAMFEVNTINDNEVIALDHLELTFNQFSSDFSLTVFVDAGSGFNQVATLGGADNGLLVNSIQQLALDSVAAASSLVFRVEFAHANPGSALNTTLQLANIEVNGRIIDLARPTERLLSYDFKNYPTPSRVDPDSVSAVIGSVSDITEFGDPDGKGGTPDLNNFWGDSLYIKQLSLDVDPDNFSDYVTFSISTGDPDKWIEADDLEFGFGQFVDKFSLKVFVDSGDGFIPIATLGGASNGALANSVQHLDMQSVAASDRLDFRIEFIHTTPYGGANWTLELKHIDLHGVVVSGSLPNVEIGDISFELLSGGDQIMLAWGSTNGAIYAVETTTNLIDGVGWNSITNLVGTGGMLSITNNVEDVQRFYRVRLEL